MRPSPSLSRLSLLALVLLSIAAPLAAQLRPAGPERRIDGGTGTGTCPAAVALADGSFLVAWSLGQAEASVHCVPDGRVFARRLDGSGAPVGRRFVLGRTGSACVENLQLGRPQDGRLAVTWSAVQGKFGPSELVARSLADDGTVSDLLRVPAAYANPLPSGDFLVLSRAGSPAATRVVARRFDAAGQPLGPRFPVTRELTFLERVRATEAAPGVLAFVWPGLDASGESQSVRGRLFGADGHALGAPFLVDGSPGYLPLVAGNGLDRFAVIWAQDSTDVVARLYSSSGVPLTGKVPVNRLSAGEQTPSAVEINERGEVGVAWQSRRIIADREDVVARLLAADGALEGRAVPVQSDPKGLQTCGRLATDGAGRWLALWAGDGPQGSGVYARVLVED